MRISTSGVSEFQVCNLNLLESTGNSLHGNVRLLFLSSSSSSNFADIGIADNSYAERLRLLA